MNALRGNLSAFALIAPVQLMLGLVIFVPAIFVVWLSFQQSTFGQSAVFVAVSRAVQVQSSLPDETPADCVVKVFVTVQCRYVEVPDSEHGLSVIVSLIT